MFENLSDRLERSFKILKGEGKITEINVAETMKDIRRALIDADVNYKVAKTFTDTTDPSRFIECLHYTMPPRKRKEKSQKSSCLFRKSVIHFQGYPLGLGVGHGREAAPCRPRSQPCGKK